MKILYLCHPDNYHIDKWVRGLTRKGVEIQLAGLQQAEIEVAPYTQFDTITDNIRYWDFLNIAPKVRELAQNLNTDLIFASFATTFGLTAKISGIRPFVVQTWSRDIGQDPNLSFRERLMINIISKNVLQAANGITTDGMAYKDLMLNTWPEFTSKTLGTPWGIDLDFFQDRPDAATKFRKNLQISSDSEIITSTRGVGSFYQPEQVLSGILESAQQHPDATFLIPTLAHDRTKHVKKLLAQADEFQNIRIIDRLLTPEEMIGLWSATDFFISCPFFDGVSEGLSEGRAMGAIPILNPLPSNLERATPDVHAFYTHSEAVSATEVAKAVNDALKSTSSQRAQIIEANKRWVGEHADVNKTLNNLIGFFDETIRSADE